MFLKPSTPSIAFSILFPLDPFSQSRAVSRSSQDWPSGFQWRRSLSPTRLTCLQYHRAKADRDPARIDRTFMQNAVYVRGTGARSVCWQSIRQPSVRRACRSVELQGRGVCSVTPIAVPSTYAPSHSTEARRIGNITISFSPSPFSLFSAIFLFQSFILS